MTSEVDWVKRRQEKDEKKAQKRDRERKLSERCATIFIVGLVGLIIVGVVAGANYALLVTGADYQFNHSVHGHIENAYWSSDPQTMKTELELAVQGMHDLGLDNDASAKYWSWEQTPDWSMTWEYAHMKSVIDRCDEFIQWIAEQNGTGSQQMQDVYSQKLNNIRGFISPNDGGSWSDDVAKGAFLVKSYSFQTVWMPIILIVFGVSFAVVLAYGGYFGQAHSDRYERLGGKWDKEDD